MKKLIVIADWCNDSLYKTEFTSAVSGFTNSHIPLDISYISSENSINTSFLLNQIALTESRLGEPQNSVIYVGTEPRNSVDQFYVIKLISGIYICGINNEYTFSFIKDSIDKAFAYKPNGATNGFLSRDIYSRVIAHLLNSLEDDLELEEIHTNTIDEVQEHYVGQTDSFGNIITTIKHEVLEAKYSENDEVVIIIGNLSKKAIYKKNIWSGDNEQLIIGPSSFGTSDNPYVSLILKRGSAKNLFGDINSGEMLTLR